MGRYDGLEDLRHDWHQATRALREFDRSYKSDDAHAGKVARFVARQPFLVAEQKAAAMLAFRLANRDNGTLTACAIKWAHDGLE